MPFIASTKTKPSYDVIVVGSGAAGGQTAYVLAAAGVKVLMLEAGRRYDPVEETPAPEETPAEPEDVSYQAVEKEGTVTAIWEMQGQKHLRTIDPRSHEGKQILALFETAA